MISKIKSATKNIPTLNIDVNLVINQDAFSSYLVDHFKNLFFSLVSYNIDSDLIKDRIHTLISPEESQMLTKIPSDPEIKEAVFNINKDGAPGLDGFGAFFFQYYSEIIY